MFTKQIQKINQNITERLFFCYFLANLANILPNGYFMIDNYRNTIKIVNMKNKIKTIGENIRDLRKRMHLKQTELALYAGVSHKFIVELENNKKTIRLDKLFNVLDVFDLTLQIISKKELKSKKSPNRF